MQDIRLNKHRSVKVQYLLTELTRKIRSGELRPGDYLPSAQSLAKDYGVGYVSVIRVYKSLSEAGLVETVQGRGAFVRGGRATALQEIVVFLPSQLMLSDVGSAQSDWVFHQLLAGMNTAMLQRGLRMQLQFVDVLGARWREVLDGLPAGAGALFVMHAPAHYVLHLQRLGRPYALVLPAEIRDWERELPTAMADYRGGVRAAVTRLLKAGHVSIAFLGNVENTHERPRYDGLCDALAEGKLGAPLLIPCKEISREAGRQAMEVYLAEQPRPQFDLLVAGNDWRALGAMEALAAQGVRVPEDVAVLGFDDNPAATDAGLSSVRLPIRELGEKGVDWFVDAVVGWDGKTVPTFWLPCEAQWRRSTEGA
ncbi:MAG TPA: GntR family transcriptional regulator [Armatimonadota bacterium]|jgi:DNA-binding LacI/PurR family transcriptional regulator